MPGWLQRWGPLLYKSLLPPNHLFLRTLPGAVSRSVIFNAFLPQMLQRKEVSKSCDVYSYGALLFEMATQEKPFHDVLPYEIPRLTVDGKVSDSLAEGVQSLYT